MFYKCLRCFCGILLLLANAKCQFIEDSCIVEDEVGVCKLLSKCDYLVNEIRRAGSPMPGYLRRKLQAINCGFESDEPLVCCRISSQDTERNKPRQTNNNFPTESVNSNFNNEFYNGGSDVTTVQSNNRRHPNTDILPKDCGIIEGDRVIGGNRTRLYEMPWMVLISYNTARGTKLSCGGTLITQWYVLTAAHCVSFLENRLRLSGVVLGEYDIRQDPDCERIEGDLMCAPPVRSVQIDTVIPHPGYSPRNLFDDIALVRLAEPADFSLYSMKPICLPITSQLQNEALGGKQGVVAGWGVTEEGLQSPVLLSVELPIVTNAECESAYKGSPRIYSKQMCAGGVRDRDSCGGDSGGPLLVPGRTESSGVRYVQRGIVSYGSKKCGIGGLPGVYTRISEYMDWILDNIRR